MTPTTMMSAATVAVLTILGCAAASASTAPVILDLEGNPGCAQLTVNSIQSINVSGTTSGDYGPTNQRVRVVFSGSGSNAKIASWEVLGSGKPINAVIVKGGGKAVVYHYGKAGAFEDTELIKSAQSASLQNTNFCYGLVEAARPPAVIRECTLATDEIACQASDRFINYRVNVGPVGTRFDTELCQCNINTLTECDPNAVSTDPNSCLRDDQLFQLPIILESVNTGTYVCETIGGRRLCYNK